MALRAFGYGYGDILSRIGCRGCAGCLRKHHVAAKKATHAANVDGVIWVYILQHITRDKLRHNTGKVERGHDIIFLMGSIFQYHIAEYTEEGLIWPRSCSLASIFLDLGHVDQ